MRYLNRMNLLETITYLCDKDKMFDGMQANQS